MPSTDTEQKALTTPGGSPREKLLDTLERFLSEVPDTVELVSATPEARAREIARHASRKAALLAGGLALPPGPLGYITILPDLVGIWKIQAQMVADIAGTWRQELSQQGTDALLPLPPRRRTGDAGHRHPSRRTVSHSAARSSNNATGPAQDRAAHHATPHR